MAVLFSFTLFRQKEIIANTCFHDEKMRKRKDVL